ncbi:hypothetical protein HGK72_31395, partial [Mycolicibacterium fortuitum]|nr:hypothetical protein [Mycolicibacterium fortuitum]
MGIAKPTGPYVEQLLEPGGWTDADEDQLYKVANEATQALQQLTFNAYALWQRERSETFNGRGWLGDAAGAANNKAGMHSEEFVAQQNHLVNVVTWNQDVAELVKSAKEAITGNVEDAQNKIKEAKKTKGFGPLIDALIQWIAINSIINTYHAKNVTEIDNTAAAIQEANNWKSSPNALQKLLDQKQAPTIAEPGPSRFSAFAPATTPGGQTAPPAPGQAEDSGGDQATYNPPPQDPAETPPNSAVEGTPAKQAEDSGGDQATYNPPPQDPAETPPNSAVE